MVQTVHLVDVKIFLIQMVKDTAIIIREIVYIFQEYAIHQEFSQQGIVQKLMCHLR